MTMPHPTMQLARGPVMLGVAGLTLSTAERERLSHPLVGGVILFRRNYQNIEQLKALTADIRALRYPQLLIAVDHEGGRVQRFLEGFTRLPPMRILGELWDKHPSQATQQAEQIGQVLAAELTACGIDLSFTPVLDLDWGRSAIIGNRAFHRQPQAVQELALALQRGLASGGMSTCGKHFPGHGYVAGDSHHLIPQDERSLAQLQADDLQPFARLAQAGLGAIMPAHVIYPAIDSLPAGFSRIWLQDILRGQLGFDGVIFSDDLEMEGAAGMGGFLARAEAALAAGCDMVLVCNQAQAADEVLAGLQPPAQPELARRLAAMTATADSTHWQQYLGSAAFESIRQQVATLALPADSLQGPTVGEAC
ncbi:beta-N-acetylhexosaminidase [Neisseriaceae bacterium TC5R-5]|nr:beta-N-acetylhexosaminidase [Neisseriaceae bacterium TC5R-5]